MAVSILHSYFYRLRVTPTGFEFLEVGPYGVGPNPAVRLDRDGVLVIRQPADRTVSDLKFPIPELLKIAQPGDELELGFDTRDRWIQLSRDGQVEVRLGDVKHLPPPFQARNDEGRSLEIAFGLRPLEVRPGETVRLPGYRLHLAHLTGLCLGLSMTATGWFVRDRYQTWPPSG